MSFIAACPHCQAKFAAQDHLAGKNVRCPKCKVPFRIGDVVSQVKKKKKKPRDKSGSSGSSARDEDLPVARPVQSKPATPAGPAASSTPVKPTSPQTKPQTKPQTQAKPQPSQPPGTQRPAAAKPTAAKPTATAPPASTSSIRSWKEIAQELAPEPPPASPAPPEPVAVSAAPHVTPAPEQAIVLNPTITAAWEALPPIILATARHQAVVLPPFRSAASPEDAWEEPIALAAATDDLDLKDPEALLRPSSEPAKPNAAAAPPEEEVIELGVEDLVIEEGEEIVELSDDDFLDETPAIQFDESDDVIEDVEVIEEPSRRSSSTMAIPAGPAALNTAASVDELEPLPSRSNRGPMWLVVGGGGGLALVLVLIGAMFALGGGSPKFEPSDTFRPTSDSPLFLDPSHKISVRFPDKFAAMPPRQHFGGMIRGANLIGRSETFRISYSDMTPVATPPSGAKPLREHWLMFDLPEMADSNAYVTSIRRHMIGSNYAVEYRLDIDVQRRQPGQSRILLIFIQHRMFLIVWSGERYRDEVDDFFASFSIGDDQFGQP